MNDEQHAEVAARQADYRRRQRVAASLLNDELALAEAQVDRATKRLSAIVGQLPEASSDDSEAAESDESDEEDDFDEAPTDDDDDEESDWTTDRVNLLFNRCVVNDRFMTTEIGVGVARFFDLVALVGEPLKRTRYDGEQRSQTNPRTQKMSDQLQFFVYMRWMRQVRLFSVFAPRNLTRSPQYRTYRQMAHDLDLPKKYVVKIVYRCGVALNAVAHATPHEQGGLAKPTPAQLVAIRDRCKGIAQYGLENYPILIDGIVVRIHAPPRELRDRLKSTLYNKHYRCWGYTVLVMCDLRGMCVWTSPALQCDEQTGAKENKDKLALWLSSTRDMLHADVGYLTDSLYSFNHTKDKPGESVLHLWSIGPGTLAAVKSLLSAESTAPAALKAEALQTLYTSRYVAQLRAVVENRNRQMRMWGVLNAGAVFRGRLFSPRGVGMYMLTPTMLVENVAFVLNRHHLNTPLRAADWRPQPLLWRGVAPAAGFKCFYPKFGYKTEMVNRSRMQSRLPKVAREFVPQSKRRKAKVESDEDESVSEDEFDDEIGDYMYIKPKNASKVELNERQAALVDKNGRKPERFKVADDALRAAEALKRRKT
jgi:hypothetical protein